MGFDLRNADLTADLPTPFSTASAASKPFRLEPVFPTKKTPAAGQKRIWWNSWRIKNPRAIELAGFLFEARLGRCACE